MSSKIVALLAVPLVVAAFFAGRHTGRCGSEQQGRASVAASKDGTPVARFDGTAITAEELKAQIEEQAPFVRARYATPEGRREFLDNLVRFELLAREAEKKGYADDPEVVRQHKRNMVALFVQKEFEEPQQKQAVPPEELEKYYQAHLSEYVRPERVRIAHVFFEAPVADAARRKAVRAEAEAALKSVREKETKDYGAFADLARSTSQDLISKPLGGDLQFLSREDLAKRVGAEVAEAAFSAKEAGKVLDKVVETPQGLHLIKVLGRENALDLKLENVKEAVRSRLLYERRGDAYRAFLDGIKQKAGLTVDSAALDAVKIDTEAAKGSLPVPKAGAIPPAPPKLGGGFPSRHQPPGGMPAHARPPAPPVAGSAPSGQ